MDEYGVVRRCKILMQTTNLRGARVWPDRAFFPLRPRASVFSLSRVCPPPARESSCLYIGAGHRGLQIKLIWWNVWPFKFCYISTRPHTLSFQEILNVYLSLLAIRVQHGGVSWFCIDLFRPHEYNMAVYIQYIYHIKLWLSSHACNFNWSISFIWSDRRATCWPYICYTRLWLVYRAVQSCVFDA
jgi:hypothetical protein